MSILIPELSRGHLIQSFVKHPSKVSSNTFFCVYNILRKPGQTKCKYMKSFNPNGMKQNFHSSPLKYNSQSSLTQAEKLNLLSSQMNMRLLNENSFLSWCRNAYLSTVVGIAMMEQSISTLAQGAGFGAFLIGGMNLYWGTGCHVTNLIRLRQITGMSNFNLSMNVFGSILHCMLYTIVLIFYIGFLDEKSISGENTIVVETQETENERVYKV